MAATHVTYNYKGRYFPSYIRYRHKQCMVLYVFRHEESDAIIHIWIQWLFFYVLTVFMPNMVAAGKKFHIISIYLYILERYYTYQLCYSNTTLYIYLSLFLGKCIPLSYQILSMFIKKFKFVYTCT